MESSVPHVQDFTAIAEATLFDRACEAPSSNLKLGVELVAAALENNFPNLLGSIDNLHDTFGAMTQSGMLKQRFRRLVTKHRQVSSEARKACVRRGRSIVSQEQMHGVSEGN